MALSREVIDNLLLGLQEQSEPRSVIFVRTYVDRIRLFDELVAAGFDADLSIDSWLRGEHAHVIIGEGGAMGWHAPSAGIRLWITELPRTREIEAQLRARLQ